MTDSTSPTDQPETSEELPPLMEEGAAESGSEGDEGGPDDPPLLPDPGSPAI
ncbi:MAG TPA: hypothetical protein VHE80_08660 [Acidimicrobiales bacterium]|nr:hypothetical protein [Acidimicrobiales bacterium]